MPQSLSKKSDGQWNGKITGIHDIEETLWDPKLGIKGMVDVSVEVRDASGVQKVPSSHTIHSEKILSLSKSTEIKISFRFCLLS